MRALSLGIVLLAGSPVLGQIDSNTLTIATARTVNFPPDQAIVAVHVQSTLNSGLDDVVAALAGAGITAANLDNVSTRSQDSPSTPMLDWTFAAPVSFAKLKSFSASLKALQQTIGRNNSGMTLTFYPISSQWSAEAQPPCPFQDLVAGARVQAQKVAGAAGLGLGPILSLSDDPTGVGGSVPTSAYRLSAIQINFVSGAIFSNLLLYPTAAPASTCSLAVKFQLLRYQ